MIEAVEDERWFIQYDVVSKAVVSHVSDTSNVIGIGRLRNT